MFAMSPLSRLLSFLLLFLCFSCKIQENDKQQTLTSDLFAPLKSLEVGSASEPKGVEFISTDNQSWTLRGRLAKKSGTIVLKPHGKHWDISAFTYLRIDVTNNGPGLVWIQGRLDNKGAQSFAHSSASAAFIMPGERVTLGFPYSRSWEENDAPSIYDELSGKPNGHRTHWKKFDPKLVTACRLKITSSANEITLDNIEINLAQRYGMEANSERVELPYLNRFGQVRTDNWPGKLHDEAELKQRSAAEEVVAAKDSGPKSFNRYGGWASGPKLDATGFFRVAKHNGKWWIIDPEGRLFFSQGLNTVGYFASTPLAKREELFEWLPKKEAPMFAAMMLMKGKHKHVSFLRGNLHRTFGGDWHERGHARIHQRLRRWGINTLGGWSDSGLINSDGKGGLRTPYTEVLHVWRDDWLRLTEDTPDPYAKDFSKRVNTGLKELNVARSNDPWCMGVFVDNETDWPRNLVEDVFAAPATQPAKAVFIEWLKAKYKTIETLNQAWKTKTPSWQALAEPQELPGNPARKKDFEKLYGLLADRYYRICRDEMRRVLPNHLYLGSRVHTCPPIVARAAGRYVDVYSMNSYVELAGAGTLPKDIDKPVLIAEYHFAAPDRGVPGVGLSPVGDQLARSRSFSAFVTAGLLNRQVVGTHWFTYADQSATGRPYENYQVGFVDVTDTPYPILTKASRDLAERMYELRAGDSTDLLGALELLWNGGETRRE